MKCDEFELQIQELLDQRAYPSTNKQLELHAGECNSCRETLVAATALCESLDLVDVPEISSDFIDRVMAEFSQPIRPPKSTTKMIAALAVVAATLLIALIPSVQVWLKPGTPVATDPNFDNKLPDKPVPTKVASKIANHESPSIDEEHPSPRPQNNDTLDGNPLIASLTFPDLQSLSDMSQQIDSDKIPGVRPIRSSFGVVIGLLRRALPGNSSDDADKPQAGMGVIETQKLS